MRQQQRPQWRGRFGQRPRPVLPRVRRGRAPSRPIKKYAKAYDKADVTTQWITGTNFESKLFAALLTDNAPDLFEFHPQIQLIKSGQVADLTDIIDPVKDDFNQADIESHTVDGKIYGVRMIDDPQFFFYRQVAVREGQASRCRPRSTS